MDGSPAAAPTGARRLLRTWALVGAVGLLTGAVYASGFASTTETLPSDPSGAGATPVFGQESAALQSLYSGTTSAAGTLVLTFDGVYAVISANTPLFKIDLSGADPYGHDLTGTYFVDVFVTNWSDLGYAAGSPEYSHLNIKFLRATIDPAADCDDDLSVYDGVLPANARQLSVDRVDAHVTFEGLAAGSAYCVGVHAEDALTQAGHLDGSGVIDGTFITRPDPELPPAHAPQFRAVVSRSA